MELVYLWVEDYKNIHKQGFNFSPRFRCDYDKDKNELTIEENVDYIPDFFGENINITAIVGKNGSGKSSLFEILEDYRELKYFIIYRENGKNYCEYHNISLNLVSNFNIIFIDKNNNFNNKSFYPKIIRVAHNKKIGENSLSHYYFGEYSGIYGGWHIERRNFYNLLEARFFVPRYINISIEHFEIFNKLKYLYKFDTLRLILKNNSTEYIRKFIDKEISIFRKNSKIQVNNEGKFCVYEENSYILSRIKRMQEKYSIPNNKVKINLYNRDREKIVSILENIENIHRSQTFNNAEDRYNKYTELDLAILVAFFEYFLKNTEPCELCKSVLDELISLEVEIKENLYSNKYHTRVARSYILSFFEKLNKYDITFNKGEALSIHNIIESIKYLQGFENYFDKEGNPYIDISIDDNLKENIHYLKIMQKIFFDYEFDCGEEGYLRVFEYTLVNKQVGSSYKTISDGEKQFIQFAIDIIYHFQTLKEQNFTPEIEQLAMFLVDEPDNALHPFWKKRVIANVIEILKGYLNIPNLMVHFIYSTHSPFLLSDIPKQNIIFLDKDEKGNCKVVDGLKEKKQTFGANIHTLLSDSFFMEDGLMGEFAKGKINEIIDFHKLIKKNRHTDCLTKIYLHSKQKKFWQTQKIIGEEYLKQVIKNHLVEIEKKLLGKDRAKDEEIKRVETYLESLKR